MPKKLKITLGVLLVIAGFLLTRIGLFLKDSAEKASRVRGETTTAEKESPFLKDSDNDGVADYNESYYRTDPFNADTDGDGYLDGEEVASGCRPTIPSDDCDSGNGTNRLPKNITEHFGSLMFGGLLSNDLKKDNPTSSNYLGSLIDEALETKKLLLLVDDVDLGKIPNGDPLSTQDYLYELENVLKKYLLIEENPKNLNVSDFRSFDFSPFIQNLDLLHAELSKISPSQDWIQTHEKLLKFALKLKNHLSSLSEQKQDPLKALLALSSTESLLNEYDEIMKEITNKIRTENLKTNLFAPHE